MHGISHSNGTNASTIEKSETQGELYFAIPLTWPFNGLKHSRFTISLTGYAERRNMERTYYTAKGHRAITIIDIEVSCIM